MSSSVLEPRVEPQAPADPAPAPEPIAVAGSRRPHVIWTAAPAALVLLGLILPNPVCLLLGVIAAASLYLRRWLALDAAVPVAALAVLVVAVLTGLAADAAQVDLLDQPVLVAAVWAAATGALLYRARQASAVAASRPARGPAFFVAQLPAAVAVAVAAVQQLDLERVASWMFFGTDFAEHVVMLERVQRVGALDYSVEAYPRGAQALLAFFSVPGLPDPGTAALLSYDLRLVAATAWLSLALLLWSMAAVILRTGGAMWLPEWWRAGAALGLGVLVLCDSDFTLVFVAMAATPGLLAAVAMWVVPLVVLSQHSGRHRPTAALVTLVAAVALTHLWTPLILVPLMAGAAALLQRPVFPALREARAIVASATWMSRIAVALAVVAGAGAASVPIIALLRASGLGLASIPGDLPAPNLVYVAVGLVAALLIVMRHGAGAGVAGAILGAACTFTVLLWSAGGGLDISQYYPRKAVWFLGVLLFPFAAMAAAALLRAVCVGGSRLAARCGSAAGVLRITGAAVLVAFAVGYLLPLLVVAGSLAVVASQQPLPTDARKLEIVLEHGDKYAPAVSVPIGLGLRPIPRHSDTYVISKLFQFKTGQTQTFGYPVQACNALREVAGGAPAVVVTDLDVDVLTEMMRRQGCSASRIVQVPGVHPGVLQRFRMQLEEDKS